MPLGQSVRDEPQYTRAEVPQVCVKQTGLDYSECVGLKDWRIDMHLIRRTY